jgi:hypothetical protein
VLFLEAKFPQIKGIGWGSNWPINAKFGAVGDVVVFKYAHVAYIVGLAPNGWILDEANFVTCKHTTGRILPFDDSTIKGFWTP